jgi:hypothetical protein
MFNDKLVIFTYKNTIYQSKLKLLAIFVTILVCKQHTLFQIWKGVPIGDIFSFTLRTDFWNWIVYFCLFLEKTDK